MTGAPTPGPDEIVLSAPGSRDLCHSLEHLRAGRPAQVRVVFGELGTRFTDELWPECWHHSYPMCGPCWWATRRTAAVRRPALVIRYATGPPAETGHGPALARAAGPRPEPAEPAGRPAR